MLTRALPRSLLLLTALLAVFAGIAPGASAKPSYVSLGDSFTAGPLVPVQVPPFGCLKSNNNYPHIALRSFRPLVLRDASCSGAETEDMTQSQDVDPNPDPPPQFDALRHDTRLVTVGIGGNDMGFSEIIRECSSTSPQGQPCQDRYVVDGNDEISDRIAATAPKIAEVLAGIGARSPRADVYVVNYLPILPETGGGCWPQVPVTPSDVQYLREKHKELNAMLADEAAAAGAGVVDAYSAGIGYGACQIPLRRWVEPTAPASAAAPYHPNLDGMRGTARALEVAASGP